MNIYAGVLIDMTIAVVFDGLACRIRASNANVSAEVALWYTPCVLAVGTTVIGVISDTYECDFWCETISVSTIPAYYHYLPPIIFTTKILILNANIFEVLDSVPLCLAKATNNNVVTYPLWVGRGRLCPLGFFSFSTTYHASHQLNFVLIFPISESCISCQ